MDSKQGKLNSIFARLQEAGKCRNKKEFAALLDVSYTGLTRAMNGDEQYLTNSLLAKAVGLMATPAPSVPEDENAAVLVIPYGARGGTIGDFLDGIHDYYCERITSPIKGADYAMEVTGDSMAPEYPSGSRVLIKKIDPVFIEWNEVYVLDTPNGAVIKRIRNTDNPDVVECVSINPAYQSYTIPGSFVRGWYRVLMVMALK